MVRRPKEARLKLDVAPKVHAKVLYTTGVDHVTIVITRVEIMFNPRPALGPAFCFP